MGCSSSSAILRVGIIIALPFIYPSSCFLHLYSSLRELSEYIAIIFLQSFMLLPDGIVLLYKLEIGIARYDIFRTCIHKWLGLVYCAPHCSGSRIRGLSLKKVGRVRL